MRRPETMSKSLSRAVRKMIGSAAELVAQADVEQREVRQLGAKALGRRLAIGVRAHLVAVLLQHVGVVCADRRVVLDDRHSACHGAQYIAPGGARGAVPALCHY